ncbi:MAG: GH92 family glycosyl hydrolase [Prolixibacteraceae bacterium]|nr:GH92 family glycosyl hydrolase [Prolixibacteraceae bacterium]
MKFRLKTVFFVFSVLVVLSCKQEKDYTKQVNVFVGTDFHGHTFSGATMPHGMVQLSPDTRTETWDGCSGYHYSDSSILGFSHIHYSGVGSGGGADILLMPTVGDIQIHPGDPTNTKSGYRAAFSHEKEKAGPGWYSVEMEDDISVELTATSRVGFHKYTFQSAEKGNVILNLVHGINDKIDSLFLKVISDTKIEGFRHCHAGLDGNRTIFFVAEFSQPMTGFGIYENDSLLANSGEAAGRNIKAHFSFDTKNKKEVRVKVALSRVDFEGAEKNLAAEIPDWDFEKVRKMAKESWNRELSKIEVEGGTEVQRRTFYTALYHTHIHPNINADVDGRYRSTDRKVYTQNGFENYTTFSLWDTFRALHPLYTIIDQQRTTQYIRSFLERYQHFGNLPIMEFGGTEGFAMIGYHSLPVLADAWAKGIRDYDGQMAFEAMKKLSESFRSGKAAYKQLGFMPFNEDGQSVSKTLEYSYDDWCVSVLAKDFSETDYHFYASKGQFYRNLWDVQTGFMHPKGSNYNWFEPFDPAVSAGNYTEGNAWQYSMFVPHDINGLINLLGGGEKMEAWLDACFNQKTSVEEMPSGDVTGLIGQYAHGNEPSHHMAWLYNFTGKPAKSQEIVAKILSTLYNDKPDGLCGNDDAGQMSAWYIFGSLGFYPVTPGLPSYVMGAPVFDKAILHLENGKDFIIRSEKTGLANTFVQSAKLNGKEHFQSFLNHSEIMQGGELVVTVGDSPGAEWGVNPENRPQTAGYRSAAIPEIKIAIPEFLVTTEVALSVNDTATEIRYTLDGTEPVETSPLYQQPFTIDKSATIKARGFAQELNPSYSVWAKAEKLDLIPASKPEKEPQPGIVFEYFQDYCVSTEDIQKYSPASTGVMPVFSLAAIPDDREFAYRFKGFLKIPQTGIYTLTLKANDGSTFYLDGKLLLDYDTERGSAEKSASRMLEKGFHPFVVNYFQMGGKKSLNLNWKKPGGVREEIPAEVLFH